jgi:hypothetical protein
MTTIPVKGRRAGAQTVTVTHPINRCTCLYQKGMER